MGNGIESSNGGMEWNRMNGMNRMVVEWNGTQAGRTQRTVNQNQNPGRRGRENPGEPRTRTRNPGTRTRSRQTNQGKGKAIQGNPRVNHRNPTKAIPTNPRNQGAGARARGRARTKGTKSQGRTIYKEHRRSSPRQTEPRADPREKAEPYRGRTKEPRTQPKEPRRTQKPGKGKGRNHTRTIQGRLAYTRSMVGHTGTQGTRGARRQGWATEGTEGCWHTAGAGNQVMGAKAGTNPRQGKEPWLQEEPKGRTKGRRRHSRTVEPEPSRTWRQVVVWA